MTQSSGLGSALCQTGRQNAYGIISRSGLPPPACCPKRPVPPGWSCLGSGSAERSRIELPRRSSSCRSRSQSDRLRLFFQISPTPGPRSGRLHCPLCNPQVRRPKHKFYRKRRPVRDLQFPLRASDRGRDLSRRQEAVATSVCRRQRGKHFGARFREICGLYTHFPKQGDLQMEDLAVVDLENRRICGNRARTPACCCCMHESTASILPWREFPPPLLR